MKALCLSLIISLIISQIRSKYFNSFLINCAPQGVWRPAGLAIRVEGREHKCKKKCTFDVIYYMNNAGKPGVQACWRQFSIN